MSILKNIKCIYIYIIIKKIAIESNTFPIQQQKPKKKSKYIQFCYCYYFK